MIFAGAIAKSHDRFTNNNPLSNKEILEKENENNISKRKMFTKV